MYDPKKEKHHLLADIFFTNSTSQPVVHLLSENACEVLLQYSVFLIFLTRTKQLRKTPETMKGDSVLPLRKC